MTKVALVANWDWVLYQFRLGLARGLRNAGYEVTLICPRGEWVPKLEADGFRWREWELHRSRLNLFTEMLAIRKLTELYREIRPDVAHHSTIKPNVYGSFAARRAEVPWVINAFSGLGFVFSGTPFARLLRAGLTPVMRNAFAPENVFTVFDNASDQAKLVGSGIVQPSRSFLIPGSGVSGVDTEVYRPGQPNGRSEVNVLMGARLLLDKGVGELVEAARLIRNRGLTARFQVAGGPDRNNPAAIPDAVLEQWRIEGAVEFLGQRKDMLSLLQQSDVAILPSYHEGTPRFLLEAAATGLPLVATDIEGCRTIVRNQVNGFLVPVRDAEALADAVEPLIRDAGLRKRMGSASREIALAEFSESRIVARYLEIYRKLENIRSSPVR
jgi:glycosyltransferase involved in cell wall biosynthesis